MNSMEEQNVCMKIYISESDKGKSGPLYKELLELFRSEKLNGATVTRAIAGFGAKSHVHSANILSLSQNMPIVIEVVDTRENIDGIMPKIDTAVKEGLITLQKVNVVRYVSG